MPTSIKNIIGELEVFRKEAQASLEGIDSMPGSENDKPIPSGATEPDPKVKDDTIDNQEHKSTEGAKPGSDFPANNVNETQANEPVLTPEKKPLDTADANAKEAAAKGNNLVDFILKTKQAAAQPKTPVQAAAPVAPTAPAAPAAPATKEAAPANTVTLDMALMAKIAAIALADEEGQFAIQQALVKRAGAEFTKEIFDVLEKRAAEEQAAWEFTKGAQDAEAMIGDLQEAQGAADAEAALGGEAAGAEAGSIEDAAAALDDYSAEEIVQAVQDLAQEGAIPPEQAEAVISAVTESAGEEGSPEDISEEDVAEALVQAVDEGRMSPEQAQAVVAAISEGEGDPAADQALAQDVAAAGGEGGEGGAAAAAPADEATDAEKAAAVKEAAEKRAAFKAQLVAVLKKGKK